MTDRYTFRNVSTARLQDTWVGSEKLINAQDLQAVSEVVSESFFAGHEIKTLYGANTYPDHDTLRCMDHMINRTEWTRADQIAAGEWIAQYYIDNHARLGVYLIIWNTQIIRSYDKTVDGTLVKAWTWVKYTGSSNPHTDHVHVEFVDGYRYSPPDPGRDGAWYQVTTEVLNGRSAPSITAPIVITRTRGYTLRILTTRQAEGRTWGQGSGGVWYALDFLALTGDTYTVNTDELNGRYEPSVYGPVAAVRPRGYDVLVQTTATAEGFSWGRASDGLWYSLSYLVKKG